MKPIRWCSDEADVIKMPLSTTAHVPQEEGSSLSLKCNISIDVNQLEEGIKLALKDDREKNSDALGRLAVFAGSSAISRLPPYLTVHMVRFFYKADVQQKAKILRKVTGSPSSHL